MRNLKDVKVGDVLYVIGKGKSVVANVYEKYIKLVAMDKSVLYNTVAVDYNGVIFGDINRTVFTEEEYNRIMEVINGKI